MVANVTNAAAGGNGRVRAGGLSDWSKPKPTNYAGEACAEVLAPVKAYRNPNEEPGGPGAATERGSMADYALLAICEQRKLLEGGGWDKSYQAPKIDEFPMREAYASFDDRKFDHLRAGLMLVYAEYGFPGDYRRGPKSYSTYELTMRGIAFALSQRIEAKAVREQLRDAEFPNEAIGSFIDLMEGAYARSKENHEALDPGERAILYQEPIRVVERRARNYRRHSEIYRRLDGLKKKVDANLERSNDPSGVLARLVELRGEYLESCNAENCLRSPLYQRISRQFVRLHVGQENAAGVYAEQAVYTRPNSGSDDQLIPNLAPLRNDIQYHRWQAARSLYAKFERFQEAREGGADEKAALSMVGGGPILRRRPHELLVDDVDIEMDNLGTSVPGSVDVERIRAEVSRTEEDGERVRLVFRQRYETKRFPVDCETTNRVERIEDDGEVVYEKECTYREERVDATEFPPITVPAREGDAIRRGDEVLFFGSEEKKRGHVVRVFRDDETVQIREHVLDQNRD